MIKMICSVKGLLRARQRKFLFCFLNCNGYLFVVVVVVVVVALLLNCTSCHNSLCLKTQSDRLS